jgi:DNA-binding NarL/FixJ family response regulator
MKVIICEDLPDSSDMVAIAVKDVFPQAEVISFTNAISAVTIISKLDKNVDLVITDLDFDGSKLFDVVQTCAMYKVPCIIYSAFYNKAFVLKAKEIGITAYVSKSSGRSHLMEVLKSYLSHRNYISHEVTTLFSRSNEIELPFPDIDEKERVILNHIMQGKSGTEVAKLMKLTTNTIHSYVRNATARNNCTKSTLIARMLAWEKFKSL